MTGFPLRHPLSSFGPKLQDARPIENPVRETGAHRLNLTENIASAASLLMPRASVVAEWVVATSSLRILHQEEAWNQRHEQAHPILARVSAGLYTYTFASSYLDDDGVTTPFEVIAARSGAMVVSASFDSGAYSRHFIRSPTVVELRLWQDVTGTEVDCRFWLEVL